MRYHHDQTVECYMTVKFDGPRTSPQGPRPNFVPFGPRAPSVVSIDSGRLVDSNNTILHGVIPKDSKKRAHFLILPTYQNMFSNSIKIYFENMSIL